MRIRPSTLAIAAAVALVFSGLYLAERSLRDAELSGRQSDAQEVAAVLRSFLLVQAEALTAFQGLYLDGGVPTEARFRTLADGVGPHLARFDHVWAADSTGVVRAQARFGGPAGRPGVLPAALDVDTVARGDLGAAVARSRRTRRTVTTRPLALVGGDTGVVLVAPIVLDGRVRGVVGGSIPLAALRAAVVDRRSARDLARQGLLVVAEAPRAEAPQAEAARGGAATVDTLLFVGRRLGPAERLEHLAGVPLPGGGTWRLTVQHARWSRVRVQLWGVALAALAALGAGAWHERRQTRRMADRSRELERLSEELLRANRAKSEFLANVSHELRTPLNAIVGFTELLRDGVYGELSPRQAGPVQRIEASASHLRSLVDQVLDLAKMTAGRLEVQRELVDLRQVVLDVGTEMEPLVAERELTFAMTVGGAVPRVRTDPTHVRQILVNLLGNAVKFTDAGGVTVRMRLVAPDGDARVTGSHAAVDGAALRQQAPDPARAWAIVQVADTGPGIARRDQARIFDEFEQVNAGSRGDSDRRGTGLGLPISRRLAHLLGGELTVESQVGKGSVFTLWLPVS